MAAVYTNARALMAVEATSLAAEATTAGLTSLATALTNLASEISTNNTPITGASDSDYYTNLFQIYSQALIAASNIIKSRIGNDIKSYLNTINTNIGTITTNTGTIATNIDTMSTNIATQTVAITGLKIDLDILAANSTIMKNLAQGTGIRIIGPYEVFGMISVYRLLIEQAKILDTTESASASQIQAAITEVTRLAQLIRSNVPKEF